MTLILNKIGTSYPSAFNKSWDRTYRITFKLAGTDEDRSVEVGPRERITFHSRDGALRADLIEVLR